MMTVTTANPVVESPNDDSAAVDKNIFSEPQDGIRRVNNDPRQKQPKQNNQPRRDKRDVHGWVILDKPIGMTSTHAVAVVKRVYTNLAVLDVTDDGFAVREMVPGMTLDELQKVTDAPLHMAKM